jgi:hypothetical protein
LECERTKAGESFSFCEMFLRRRSPQTSKTASRLTGENHERATRREAGNRAADTAFPRNRSGFHPRACSADSKQRLIIIKMTQVPAPANSFYRRAVRYLAYQALSDSD